MIRGVGSWGLLLVAVWLLTSCGTPQPIPNNGPQAAPTPSPMIGGSAGIGPPPSLVPIPTLFPTKTPWATTTPFQDTPPTAVPKPNEGTPIDYDQPVLIMDYLIPGLGLERRLGGTIDADLQMSDEATGAQVVRQQQAAILLELQGILNNLSLAPLPNECPLCVRLSYELPLANLSGSGWLTNTQLLASMENFTAIYLGPHFPTNTIIGLRRSASAYHSAHTIAVTSDGQVWIWSAVEAELSAPVPIGQLETTLLAELEALPLEELAETYEVPCDGRPVETLFLQKEASQKTVRVLCPELSLPSHLLPLYLNLDTLINAALADSFASREDELAPMVPLATWLEYQRADGTQLTIEIDGAATLVTAEGDVVTTTLPLAEIEPITAELLALDVTVPGLAVYFQRNVSDLIIIRDKNGFNELGWDSQLIASIPPAIVQLDAWITALMPTDATPTPISTPTTEPTATPTPSP
ncbi:MAG TPA: hypothetical protein VLL52_18615 [Anaerolineae bacterium]|nr:hypothetical protein [Anaerolineae bacterium]